MNQEQLALPWYESPMMGKQKDTYNEGDRSVHNVLFSHVRQLEEDQADIHLENMLNVKLYTNREPMSFTWDGDYHAHFRPISSNLENVIQSVVDALSSRIGTERPKATIVPRGADFCTYMKAKKLDKYLWGEFTALGVHRKMDKVFTDSCVYGTGALKIGIDGNELFCERVNPDEIIVDQRECVSEDMPMTMHHRKIVSRLWLLKTYGKTPEMRKRIKEAQSKSFSYTSYRTPPDDQIVLIESWKLPTRKGADDGRHSLVIENATLVDERYDRERFPFVFLKYGEPQFGFYGRSLVGDLTGYQIRLNELNEAIRYGQDLMCVPRIWIEQGSAIVRSEFDNRIGKSYTYRGVKPDVSVWNAFNAEIYQERERIKSSAYEFAGISEHSAQGKAPGQARFDSAPAFREFYANNDERFNRQAQAQEQAYKEVADHIIELSADLYSGKEMKKSSTYRYGNLAEEIDWDDVDMPRDKFVLEISASSIINMTPAARKDTLNEWLDRELITPAQYKAWAGQPDLERLSDEMGAGINYTEYMIAKMLEGEAKTPDTMMQLNEAFPIVHQTYMHLRTLENVPMEIIVLFSDWLLIAEKLLNPDQPPEQPMAQPGMEQGMQPGMEQMPPDMMGGGMPMQGQMAAGGVPPMMPPEQPMMQEMGGMGMM